MGGRNEERVTVAYSFQRRFVAPIHAGLDLGFGDPPIPCEPIRNHGDAKFSFIARPNARPKRQTIRAERARHARPGEMLQLYCSMRTKSCFLIGRARCSEVAFIRIDFTGLIAINRQGFQGRDAIDEFARGDGFRDFAEMREFWREQHPDIFNCGTGVFEGILIRWEKL